MTPTRRERLERLERIGFVANLADAQLRGADKVPMPLDLAERVRVLAEAARDVATITEREIRFLEEARDWPGEGHTP